MVATRYDVGSGMQLTETHEWIEALGVHYALGVDGLGLLMVLLTVAIVPPVMLASWRERRPGNSGARAYFAWALALEGCRWRSTPPPTSSSSTSSSRPP